MRVLNDFDVLTLGVAESTDEVSAVVDNLTLCSDSHLANVVR